MGNLSNSALACPVTSGESTSFSAPLFPSLCIGFPLLCSSLCDEGMSELGGSSTSEGLLAGVLM